MSTYNGWPNRETWNVMLWLDNDEGAYRHYVAEVRRFYSTGVGKRPRLLTSDAERFAREALGDKTGDGIPLDSPRIRWGKIAEAMRESA